MKYAICHGHFIRAEVAKRKERYTCPLCHRQVILHRRGTSRLAFFVHSRKSKEIYNPAETREHLTGKRQLFEFFNPIFKDVKIEKYLSQINQWPDLIFKNTAIEFQCSPISVKRLKERISGYAKLGIKSWWILGSHYYKRRLRPGYLARFINYSKRLGFFILFWHVHINGLEIHYQIREVSGRLNYKKRLFFKYQELVHFLQKIRFSHVLITRYQFTSFVDDEIKLNQKRLFYGDTQLLRLQSYIGPFHNSLMGCPLICHYSVITFPIFRRKALLWRIRVLILLSHNIDLNFVYRQTNADFKLPLDFCQINNSLKFYRVAFRNYIKRLQKHRYLRLSSNGKKIVKLKEPHWFNSVYDKIKFLK